MAIVSLADLRDMDLVDSAGTRLGAVKDLLVDPASGRARYTVVAPAGGGLGGALGLDERLVPIPFALLRVQNGQLVLGRDPASLAGAPGFARRRPPSFDEAYEGEIAAYWGVAAGDGGGAGELTAGDLVGGAPPTVPDSADVGTVARALAQGEAEAAQVVDARGRVLGIVTLREVGLALGRAQAAEAAPVAGRAPRPTTPDAVAGATVASGADVSGGRWSVVDASPAGQVGGASGTEPADGTATGMASGPAAGAADERAAQAGTGGPEGLPATSVAAADGAPASMYSGVGGPAGRAPAGAPPWPGAAGAEGGASAVQTAGPTRPVEPAGAAPERPEEQSSRCPQCGTVNRAGALFCAKCGTRLR